VWTGEQEKQLKFLPIQVGMLAVEHLKFSGDQIDCWMDIQRGQYPAVSILILDCLNEFPDNV
jgi:hypothetical protein